MGLFDHMTDDKRRQLVGLLLLFLGLLLAASLGSHVYFSLSGNLGPDIWATQLGLQNREISNWMFVLLGFAAWIAPLLLIMWGWNRIADGDVETLALRSVFLSALSIIVVTLIHVGSSGGLMHVSGLVGAYLSDFGVRHVGRVGTFLIGIGGIALIALLTTEFDLDLLTEPFIALAERIGGALSSFWEGIMSFAGRVFDRDERPERTRRAKPAATRRRKADEEQEPRRRRETRRDPATAQATSKKKRVQRTPTIVQAATPRAQSRPAPKRPRKTASYALPPLSLFDDPPADAPRAVSREELLARSQLLEEKLADFGVEATVAHVRPGPVITRFEVEPARGVKVSQIANLQDDLALAMRATAIRIIAPIPGRGAVGIEIPNEHPAIVYLKETLESDAFQKIDSEIPLLLGKDTTGKAACADLAGMPHLLVAGATGSGKSICLNALITGILCRSTPDEVRFLMVDPKRLELPRYAGIPHQLSPVVTEAKSAAMALQWLVGEMDRRYDILSSLAVRDIYGFNKRIEDRDDLDALSDDNKHRLPHIVVIVDEFADLMVRAPREVEAPVQRLAQMARAVGIHLIFATQRPSVDVITGVIKANFASRIAFRVISMTDSRTIL
ncbi:DNA translocase FtsK 4TM domain-containing protein, partial [bacterium]|nr:DNA translocase FtsK 4TM domain-containing protein [bacterium]